MQHHCQTASKLTQQGEHEAPCRSSGKLKHYGTLHAIWFQHQGIRGLFSSLPSKAVLSALFPIADSMSLRFDYFQFHTSVQVLIEGRKGEPERRHLASPGAYLFAVVIIRPLGAPPAKAGMTRQPFTGHSQPIDSE